MIINVKSLNSVNKNNNNNSLTNSLTSLLLKILADFMWKSVVAGCAAPRGNAGSVDFDDGIS